MPHNASRACSGARITVRAEKEGRTPLPGAHGSRSLRAVSRD